MKSTNNEAAFENSTFVILLFYYEIRF